jgi:hypothetical protein
MSLIQQALEKTGRAQETRTTTPVSAPKPWERDPTGTSLEHELTQVQQRYSKRRSFYRKAVLGALIVCFVAGFSYLAIRENRPKAKASLVTATITPQMSIKIFSGNIYRLTGITNLGDRAIAVINEKIVGVGDMLFGKAVVKEIGNGEVRLDIEGKEIKLTL